MPDLSASALSRAYDRLLYEYAQSNGETAPSKLSIDLGASGEKLSAFGNAMAAKLSTGEWGGKFIMVDETTGETAAQTVVFDRSGKCRVIESSHLTRVRCGMMAVMATQMFYSADPSQMHDMKWGFVGTGRTNLSTVKTLQSLFKVPNKNIMLLGSPRQPFKNDHNFPGSKFCTKAREMSECDVVIECATIREESEVLEVFDFSNKGVLPRLFIAQDSGWMFGNTFRRATTAFTDHVAQMNSHRGTDYDWPWDEQPHPLVIRDLRHIGFNPETVGTATAYLTGIAIADLIVALESDLL